MVDFGVLEGLSNLDDICFALSKSCVAIRTFLLALETSLQKDELHSLLWSNVSALEVQVSALRDWDFQFRSLVKIDL